MILKPRSPAGFRVLPHDKFIIPLFFLIGLTLFQIGQPWLGLVFFVTVFQFFLFCNVFRVQTKLEMLWVGAALPVSLWFLISDGSMVLLSLWMTFSGCVVILWEIRGSRYHGVFWKHLNPGLLDDDRDPENS